MTCSPRLCANAGEEFTRSERLGHIVVRTAFESQYAVGFFSTCGDHDDGDVEVSSNPSQHLEAVDARQHQVEEDDVGSRVKDFGDALFGVLEHIDLEPVRLQVALGQPPHLGVVFDVYDSDLLHG